MKEIIPDEIHSAADAASEMFGVVARTPNFWFKQIIFALVPLLLGGVLGWIYISGVKSEQLGSVKESITAFITIITVLAGFVVTLMLFTGRTQGAENLGFDDTEAYIEKLVFLQFTQLVTLITHVICVLASLGWLLAFACAAEKSVTEILFSLSAAFLALSMVRTVLMPFQIFEVHFFELSVLRKEKKEKMLSKRRDFFSEVDAGDEEKGG